MTARLAQAVDLERFREPGFLVAVFAVACALVVSRRPDALLNPQFYYEDGTVFYADAHNVGGLGTLLLPYRGYFVMAQRLGALAALAVPLARAPLAFNLLAIAVEALPAVLLASRRYAHVAPRRAARLALAFLYVALPGVWGLIATLTNAQWHLAALALLVVLAAPATGLAWRAFDVAALVLSGLSGPMCFALVPIAAIVWYVRRDRWAAVLFGIAVATACVQAASLVLQPAPTATPVPLGASAGVLAQLVAQRVVYAALVGQRVSAALVASGGAAANAPAIWLAAAIGLGRSATWSREGRSSSSSSSPTASPCSASRSSGRCRRTTSGAGTGRRSCRRGRTRGTSSCSRSRSSPRSPGCSRAGAASSARSGRSRSRRSSWSPCRSTGSNRPTATAGSPSTSRGTSARPRASACRSRRRPTGA